MPSLKIGDTFQFPVRVIEDCNYAVKAVLSSGKAPVFQNLPAVISVPRNTTKGTLVFSIKARDDDRQDKIFFQFIEFSKENISFYLDSESGGIYLNSSIPDIDLFKLKLRVSDTCGMYSDSILDIRFKQNKLSSISSLQEHFQFYNLPFHIDVREDTSQQMLLRQFNVSHSVGERKISCSLSNGTTRNNLFLLKQTFPFINTYELYLQAKAKLLYTQSTSHVAVITCFDGHQRIQSSLTMHLVKNNAPVVHNLPASISISAKDTKIGSQIYFVNATDEEEDSLIISMSCPKKHCPFQMSTSGTISSVRALLAETSPIFDLKIFVSDHYNQEGPFILTVLLTDLNNPPTISPNEASLYVKENTANEEMIFQLQGSDFDGDQLTYHWRFQSESGSMYFSLSKSGEITVSSKLDFESMSSRDFNVTAWANDGISESNPVKLCIKVVDINEPPQFSSTNYSLSVYENSAGVAVIPNTMFQVSDPDHSDEITFKISGGQHALNFKIDPDSGEVSFAVDYDVRIMPSHVLLNITAIDKPGLNCTAQVDLNIEPLNWKPYLNNLPWKQTVPENSNFSGRPLYIVTSFDADKMDPVYFRASFYPSTGASKFYLNYSSGAVSLITGEKLDFETEPREYTLEVIVNDGSVDSRAANLSINVIDVNEAPAFKHDVYYAETTEPKKGLVLMKSSAFEVSDPDFNDEYNFTVEPGNYSSFFKFDPLTNDLITTLDYNSHIVPHHVMLTISVNDRGGLSDTATVDISIISLNKAPVVTGLPLSLMVSENTPNNTEIYKIKAVDPDAEDTVFYQIDYLTVGASSKFFFNQSTGAVHVSGNLDYEMMTAKEFTVRLTASDGHLNSPSYNLTIVITDSNEPPYFTSQIFYVKTLEAKERTVFTNIIPLNTIEPDQGDITQYKISKGSNHSLFAINSTTGELYFAVNYSTTTMPKVSSINVTAYDSSGLSSTARVDIDVKAMNRVPKIINLPQTVYVKEETKPGTELFQVDVYDADKDAVSFNFIYFPPQGAVWFTFDDKSRKLFTAADQMLNYEAMSDVSFILSVSVNDGKSHSDFSNLTLQIVDVNEAPHFYSRLYFIDVVESKGGTVLPMYVQFKVIDPDINDTYHFSMMSSDNSSWFSIDPITGNISFAIDYNVRLHPSNIFLVVAVKDRHNLQDTTLVNVTVHSINNAPRIVHLPPVISLPENHPAEMEVLAIQVQDNDPWDEFLYKIKISPVDGITRFYLNQTSGFLYLSSGHKLDYETAPFKNYSLVIVVSDGHVDSKPCNLTIEIIDVNEAPEFTESIYYISANEGSPGTVLQESHVVQAFDEDADDAIVYSIGSKDGNATMFSINRTSGLLSFAVNYDCTMMPHYITLWVLAKDTKGLVGRAEVRILVSHLNRIPKVKNLPALITVPENISPRLLYTLLLHDPDPNDPAFFVATFTPAFGMETFHVDTGSGAVTLKEGQKLNYEFCDMYVITITVYDGHNHSVPENFTIIIENINEAPYFLMSRYYITAPEGSAATLLPDPSLEVQDPDRNDSVTFSLAGNKYSQRFAIHLNTGILSYAVDYDVDRNAMPSIETIKIYATDKGGLQAATEIQIRITDVNDNAPVFNQSSYTIFVQITDPVGSRYLTVHATDFDQKRNAEIQYAMDDFKNLKYFGISETGDVYLKNPLRYDNSGDMRFLIMATDKGIPALSSVAMLTVILQELPSNVTFYMERGNESMTPQMMVERAGQTTQLKDLSWFGAILLLLAFLQVIGVLVLYRWLSKRCWRRNPKTGKEIEEKEIAEEKNVPARKTEETTPAVECETEVKNEPEAAAAISRSHVSRQCPNSEEKTQETENSSHFEFWNNVGSDQSGDESSSVEAPAQSLRRQHADNTERNIITPLDSEGKRPPRKDTRKDSRMATPSYGPLKRESIINAWLNC
ncbi:cadherin-23-like [Octopus sinensis]|uniref:Cadherin-23-like n=1 Tax=Octopus sinensis TaxID=2607531 RepID=A0A7E6FL00_9MOLL|nr:cadherin-23-like [Octopus sinensis]